MCTDMVQKQGWGYASLDGLDSPGRVASGGTLARSIHAVLDMDVDHRGGAVCRLQMADVAKGECHVWCIRATRIESRAITGLSASVAGHGCQVIPRSTSAHPRTRAPRMDRGVAQADHRHRRDLDCVPAPADGSGAPGRLDGHVRNDLRAALWAVSPALTGVASRRSRCQAPAPLAGRSHIAGGFLGQSMEPRISATLS